VNFTHDDSRQPYVYLSNGGHSRSSHGVAIIYDGVNLDVRFRSRDGREWTARSDNVLPGRWYHVAAAWNALDGLSLYVNGDLARRAQLPQPRPPVAGPAAGRSDEFLIGKPNDQPRVADRHLLAVDDFNFWSEYKNASDIKQLGSSFAGALIRPPKTVVLFGLVFCCCLYVRPETIVFGADLCFAGVYFFCSPRDLQASSADRREFCTMMESGGIVPTQINFGK